MNSKRSFAKYWHTTNSEPTGWNKKTIQDSPLIKDFDSIWEKLKTTYKNELSMLAYTEIPNEKEVAQKFKELIKI